MNQLTTFLRESILRLNEVKARTGLSRSTIYQWVEEDKFPKPIKLGGPRSRSVGWLDSEVSAFIQKRIEESRPIAPECK